MLERIKRSPNHSMSNFRMRKYPQWFDKKSNIIEADLYVGQAQLLTRPAITISVML